MTEDQWLSLLKSYTTPIQVINESLSGITDHLDTSCTLGHVQVVGVHSSLSPTGITQKAMVCDRGSHGCNLTHDDLQALRFARRALERLKEMQQ